MNAPFLHMPVSALNFVTLWHRTHASHIEYAVRQLEPDFSLDADLVGRDDHCRMGQWLQAQPEEIKALPAFTAVTQAHVAYHRIARELVLAYRDRQQAIVDRLLEHDFVDTSATLMAQVDDLGRELTLLGWHGQPFLPDEMARSTSSLLTLDFRVGDPDVDRGHALLVNVVNDILVAHPTMSCTPAEAADFVDTLAECLTACFAAEERLLGRYAADPARARAHCLAHGHVLNRLQAVQNQLRSGARITLAELGLFLRDWFTEHFVDYDTDLVSTTA